MAENCFCHFNGYEVKDAKARATAEEHAIKIAEVTAAIEAIAFDSVEAMKNSADLKVGMIAKTTGYYNPGDYGGAFYLVHSEKPATHSEELYSGLFAELLHPDGVLNVNTYGAHGDGVTNDVDFINKALIEASFEKIKTVYFPSQDYYVDGELIVKRGQTHLQGCHSGTTITTIDYCVEESCLFHVTNVMVTMDGLKLAATYEEPRFTGSPKKAAVYFDMLSGPNPDNQNVDADIRNCAFYDFGYGIKLYGRNVNVRNCVFTYGCYAIYEEKHDGFENRDYVIENNRFHSVGAPNSYGFSRGCIALCGFYDNEERAILINGNFADYSATFVSGNINGCTIKNNTIRYQRDGYFVFAMRDGTAAEQHNKFHTVIANNDYEYYCAESASVSRMGDTAVKLKGVYGVTIIGNTISGGKRAAIHAISCGDIKISDNNFVNCPYVYGADAYVIQITNKQGYACVMNNISRAADTNGSNNAIHGIIANVALDLNANNLLKSRSGDSTV